MTLYSAKLLFQFRVITDPPGKRRICEERIIQFTAASGKQALVLAKRKGKAAEFSYRNSDDRQVHFEFVGVMELLDIGPECGADEVWYEITERLLPMERKARLIPLETELCALRNETRSGRIGRERPPT